MSSEHKYALPPGFRLRQYIIVRLLGHGGFGLTYLADDTRLNRKVAIKELLPVDFAIRETDGTTVVARSQQDKSNFEWARQRFVEEGQTVAGLHHPSILPVHDILEEHGTAYLVTAFIDGGNMEDWLREVQHPAETDLRSITHHILDALALVHERGYLHRDVKPQNILMDRQNGLPILIDFGNARIASGAKTSNLTSVLTKGYAPFEQYQTKGRQGAFTDLYALGAVLYRAIKGVAPEDAADRWDDDKVDPLSQHPPPGYSLAFLATVDKALRMRREDRWQHCAEWKAALSVPDQPPPSPEPEPPVTTKPPADFARTERPQTQRAPKPLPPPNPSYPKISTTATVFCVLLGLPPYLLITSGIILVIAGAVTSTPSQTPVNPEASKAQPLAAETDFKVLSATKEAPFVNSLGQEFVPAGTRGVLFCKWDTRVSDYREFANATSRDMSGGIYVLKVKGTDKEGYSNSWELDTTANWNNPGFQQSDAHPVVGVSLEDARAFCEWLTKKERTAGILPAGAVYRLPRDEEWSAAVRSEKYPWGNTWPPKGKEGNYADESFVSQLPGKGWHVVPGLEDGWARTSPVGTYNANQYGLFDMGGNVWQWCDTEYKASMNSAEAVKALQALNEEKASDGTPYRVLRGASWGSNDEIRLRSTCRNYVLPTVRNAGIGFRCVLVISGATGAQH